MKSKSLIAKTHPAEYLIHKYWARKPHNILSHYIKNYFKKGDVVLDPFSGSGVFLAEARKYDLNIIGFDINPLAYLLTEVTVEPPLLEDFKKEADKLLSYANDKHKKLYDIAEDNTIRYVVHQIRTKCNNCGEIGSSSHSKKQGTKYHCTKCGTRLSFNFENLYDTEIVKIFDKNNKEYTDTKILSEQVKLSKKSKPVGNFDKTLLVNRRILAFPDMKLSDLFTPRAYSVLSDLFNEAHKIKNEKVKKAILLLLTSCVAQCSKLIPYRNNLSTGGPAWTVPGFWIAPLHLETNPIIHLDARYKKFIKGLEALNNAYKKHSSGKVSVSHTPAQAGMATIKDNSLDGIFFDPPYGDNVPYVEFSEIWNGFLNYKIEYSKEVVVSDRKEFISSWEKYHTDIQEVLNLFYKKLKKRGRVVMTFNNLDPRAWKIVLSAFADLSFQCIEAEYQIPAVVSSKAQMASNTSYIGDYYCVFEKVDKKPVLNKNFFQLTEKFKKLFYSRDGIVPQNLINRMAILTILNENMDLDFLSRIEEAITPIATKEGDYYKLRPELQMPGLSEKFNLHKIILSVAFEQLNNGRKTIQELYEAVIEKTDELGSPPISEVKQILKNKVLFDQDYCYLQNIDQQLALF